MRYQSILFDLDGTLADNREGIMNGFRYALKRLGREGEADSLPDTVIGPPLRNSFQELYHMDEQQTEEAVRLYREFYRPTGVYQCSLYPHVEETLARLKQAGAAVYLATSKARVFAEAILMHKNIARFFDSVCGSELDGRLDNKTELLGHMLRHVIKHRDAGVIMVGDRFHDAKGALDCGMDCAAALWGFGSREEFLPYGNVKAMFDDAQQLCDWLLEG